MSVPKESELAKRAVAPVVVDKALTAVSESWGDDGTSSRDLTLSRITVAQGLSQSVKDGVAKIGDIFHTGERRVMANPGKIIEVLPIICIGWWFVHELPPRGKSQGKFLRKEPLTAANDSENWKQDVFEDTEPRVRTKCLSFLVLPVDNLNGFPVLVDFQRSNRKPGMALSTVMQENKLARRPPPARVVGLSASKQSNDGNDWFVFNVQPGRDATVAELTACKRWFDIFSDKKIQAANAPDQSGSEVL
jgi:hypothetical protein